MPAAHDLRLNPRLRHWQSDCVKPEVLCGKQPSAVPLDRSTIARKMSHTGLECGLS